MEIVKAPTIYAQWDLTLTCDCPHCKEFVDLLEYDNFWEGLELKACEHDTKNSKNVEVRCPNCHKEFTIDCEY